MAKLQINEASLKTKCVAPGADAKGDAFYWDVGVEGFGVRVKPDGSRYFIVQRKLPGTGQSVRGTIGRWGTMTLTEARDTAAAMLTQIRAGVNPFAVAKQTAEAAKPKGWETYTLREALAAHIVTMDDGGCQKGSIKQLNDEIEENLGDWLDLPLANIIRPDDTTMIVERHAKITQKTLVKGRTRGGKAIAARVFRGFRACWHTARRRYPALLAYPTGIVSVTSGKRKRSPIPWEQLPAWATAVEGIENKVRADLQWFLLLTGTSGRGPLEMKWENVNFDAGTIHFPKPKGGEDRAFTVPVSGWVLAMLAKRQLANRAEYGDTPFVWPTRVWPEGSKATVLKVKG